MTGILSVGHTALHAPLVAFVRSEHIRSEAHKHILLALECRLHPLSVVVENRISVLVLYTPLVFLPRLQRKNIKAYASLEPFVLVHCLQIYFRYNGITRIVVRTALRARRSILVLIQGCSGQRQPLDRIVVAHLRRTAERSERRTGLKRENIGHHITHHRVPCLAYQHTMLAPIHLCVCLTYSKYSVACSETGKIGLYLCRCLCTEELRACNV